MGAESSMGDIKGPGMKERERRRREEKRKLRKMFKGVARADLGMQVESLSLEVSRQSGIIDQLRAAVLNG